MLQFEVVLSHQDHVIAAYRHLVSSVQTDLGPVAGLEGLVPHHRLDVAHLVSKALELEPGQQLHVGVAHDLSAALLVHTVHIVGHPEGVAHVQVVHISIKIDVLGEVRDAIVLGKCATESLAPINHDQVFVGHLDAIVVHDNGVSGCLGHLHHEGLVDHVAVDEEVRVDFIGSREGDAATICPVEHAGGESIHEHASVDALPQPARGPDEHVEVFGEEQDFEDLDGLLDVQLVGVNEYLATREHAHLEGVDELLYDVCLLYI